MGDESQASLCLLQLQLREEDQIGLLEFEGYALVWWNQVRNDVKRMKMPLINTWLDMERVLRERDLCCPTMGETFITSFKDQFKKIGVGMSITKRWRFP